MSTSGTYAFSATRDQIITNALIDVNAIALGDIPSDAIIQSTAFRLNAMVKHWETSGIHLWTVEEATLFPQVNQRAYTIGGSSTDHVAQQGYSDTTLGVSAVQGATSITVANPTGIVNGNQIGVQQDDGSIFWTTVNGVPAGAVIPLAAGLVDSSRAGLEVWSYVSNIVRPLRIPLARRHNIISKLDTPIFVFSRRDFNNLPNKDQAGGAINNLWYDRQRDTGIINIWQMPNSIVDLVNFTWYRPIQDFNAAGDMPDLPQEWILTLITNLAYYLAPGNDVPEKKFAQLEKLAKETLDGVMGWDREDESVNFGLDNQGYR